MLQAAQAAGVEVPTLCHDDRLRPAGACRLCLVSVRGATHPVPACATLAAEGLIVETHTAALEEERRTVLALLAQEYPAADVERWPEKPFHRWLRRYGVMPGPVGGAPSGPPEAGAFRDATHPYLAADLSRCIDCFRCVRICADLQGQDVWHVTGPGPDGHIVPDGPSLLESSCEIGRAHV